MNNECSIVKDLLALYSEDMVSDETGDFIKEHLEKCERCRNEYGKIKGGEALEVETQAAPIKDIKRKIVKKRIMTALLSALLVATVLITCYALLSTREYFDYSDDLIMNPGPHAVDVKEEIYAGEGNIIIHNGLLEFNAGSGDKSKTLIIFNKKVKGASYYFTYESETDTASGVDGGWVCHIEAWTSLWERIKTAVYEKAGKEQPACTLEIEGHDNYSVYYSPNNGNDETHLLGPNAYSGQALARLSLNYYLLISIGAFAVLLVLAIIFRNKERARRVLTHLSFAPASYIISQLAVKGIDATSYSLMRDFTLIMLLAVLIFCVLTAGYRVLLLKKEIKEINNLK